TEDGIRHTVHYYILYMNHQKRVVTQGSNRIHSPAAGSFFARCLPDAGWMALARSAAFLRSRYALRRLRLSRTRCCCPTGSLSVETMRNAIWLNSDGLDFRS